MGKAFLLFLFLVVTSLPKIMAQTAYTDSMQQFLKKYVDTHEVVKGKDRELLHFYPVSNTYRVVADVERVRNGSWFSMETSGATKQVYRVYAKIRFTIHDTLLTLNLYQSQRLMAVEEYREHLFLPFTDRTSGETSYEAGRYIDLTFSDIVGDKILIDFNKAYNPYCAYVSGKYNCPIPPKENDLPVAILAGEMKYTGQH